MSHSLRILTVLVAPCLVAGCVRSTTVSYLPSAEQPRVSLEEGRTMLARFVGVECDRLREAGRAEGSAELLVRTDSAGAVLDAELARGSGDSRADGVMGAVAAQLRLDDATGQRVPLRAGYRCTDGGISAVLERR